MHDEDKTRDQLLDELAALRESEERYRLLAEAVPHPVWRCDADGGLIECNRRWYEYTGQTLEVAKGNGWMKALHPDDVASTARRVQQDVAGGQLYQTEYRLRRASDGSYRWHLAWTIPRRDDQGTLLGWFGCGTDIHDQKLTQEELERRVQERTAELKTANEQLRREVEERQQAEEDLRQSESCYRELVENQGEGVGVVDAQECFTFANPAGECIFGVPHGTLVGRSLEEFMSANQYSLMLEQTKERQLGKVGTYEVEITRPNGDIRNLLVTVVPRIDKAGLFAGSLGLFFDITERREAQAALERERRTLKHMLQASDHERQLIAYDIHDGLAQQLAGAIMQLDVFAHLKETKPKQAKDAFRAGMTMLRQGHFEARRLISGVRPPILDESGVVTAIAYLVNEKTFEQGPKIGFHSKVKFTRLTPVLENAAYRIVQEALTNACKHSKSEEIRIRLTQKGDRLRIDVKDWGVGFNPKVVQENRYGLPGIRERARVLGGKCRIKSKHGEGTTVVVELPVVARDEDG